MERRRDWRRGGENEKERDMRRGRGEGDEEGRDEL